jgi:hypothetical protein
MPKFVFNTGTLRGTYTACDENGELRECVGLDFFIGISEGKDAREAAIKLLDKEHIRNSLPYGTPNILHAYEVKNDCTIDISKIIKKAKDENKKEVAINDEPCQWCGQAQSKSSAAKFAHLKKHINQLQAKELLTKEQAITIRSLTLSPEMVAIFTQAPKTIFKA